MAMVGQLDAQLDAYLDLNAEDVARIVLCLLIEEMLKERLAAFRQNLSSQPVGGFKGLGINEMTVAGHSQVAG
jgi:hypothetical protein